MRPRRAAMPSIATQSDAAPEKEVAVPESPASENESRESQQAAAQVLEKLKGFRYLTDFTDDYDDYDKRLSRLRADLDEQLPNFVRQGPNADGFRREVAAAMRDYGAAEDWWKTTVRNSNVLSAADRDERLHVLWASANTHIENAEKALAR